MSVKCLALSGKMWNVEYRCRIGLGLGILVKARDGVRVRV